MERWILTLLQALGITFIAYVVLPGAETLLVVGWVLLALGTWIKFLTEVRVRA
jgi:hypothetical protein